MSEVDRYGNKIKTNVMAAGNTIAVQENHITYQQVTYNHWDASGSSFKNSDRIGASYSAPGADSSPGELDPLGGNVGLETPYIEQPIEPPPPEDSFNEPFLLDQGDTMMVNGQRVGCSMDGMTVGCGMAMRALENGSALPAALAQYQGMRGFKFESLGLGMFNVSLPKVVSYSVGRRDFAPTAQGLDRAITEAIETEKYKILRNIQISSWVVSYSMVKAEYKVQTGQLDTTKPLKGNRLSTYTRARNIADEAIKDEDCVAAINKIFGGAIPFLNAEEVYKAWVNLGFVDGGKSNSGGIHLGRWLGGNQIALFDDFFSNSSNNDGAMYSISSRIQSSDLLNPPIKAAETSYNKKYKDKGSYYMSDDQLRAFVVLHEAVHAILQKTHPAGTEKDWDKALWNGCFKDKIVFAHR